MPPIPSFGLYLASIAGISSSSLHPSLFHGLASACSRGASRNPARSSVAARRPMVNWRRKKKFDPYETLGVSRTADSDAIKKAFYEMAKKHHPDTNKDPNAQQKFMKIKEAFEILKSPGKRREFDVQGEVSEAEMVAPMDPQIRWRRNKYSSEKGYHDYNWDAMDESPPTQAEERRKKLRQINIIAFSSMLLLYLSALYITQPADNSAKVRRHPYLKKVKFEDRIPEPKDAASARAFNEARMPKRAYVIRDYVMDDYEEEEVKK